MFDDSSPHPLVSVLLADLLRRSTLDLELWNVTYYVTPL
jgi:hypothetical protein